MSHDARNQSPPSHLRVTEQRCDGKPFTNDDTNACSDATPWKCRKAGTQSAFPSRACNPSFLANLISCVTQRCSQEVHYLSGRANRVPRRLQVSVRVLFASCRFHYITSAAALLACMACMGAARAACVRRIRSSSGIRNSCK